MLSIEEEFIPIHDYYVLIDSGATLSFFTYGIYNSIINNFISICNNIPNKNCGNFKNIRGFGYCGIINTTEDREKAIEEYSPNNNLYCDGYNYTLRKEVGACLGFEGELTNKINFGGNFMHNHDIIFDKDNQILALQVLIAIEEILKEIIMI